ncbi:MAG TPA: carbon monoxide dehydrogenase [Anaerolineae bacterium]|nr:carbon monoxide dehydrogenase [Anaerolineae bacterium]
MPKIAITGKGGVGKTTLAGLLAHVYARRGQRVLAIDADPVANLAWALGFPPEVVEGITPIAEMEELIYERTGAQPGTFGGFFKMNPRVDDIPDRFSATHRGVKLLIMGTVKGGGSGCICPESALLKALVQHLLLHRDEVVIMDMEAGVEHLGRATAQAVDALIAVVEPGRRSLYTARAIQRLAADIGLRRVYAVGNKVRNPSDRDVIAAHLPPDMPILGFLPMSSLAIEADLKGMPVFDLDPQLVARAEAIADRLGELE